MDPVGDGLDQVAQEICGRLARHLFVQLDEGELRGPVDCDDEMKLPSAVRASAMSIWK